MRLLIILSSAKSRRLKRKLALPKKFKSNSKRNILIARIFVASFLRRLNIIKKCVKQQLKVKFSESC